MSIWSLGAAGEGAAAKFALIITSVHKETAAYWWYGLRRDGPICVAVVSASYSMLLPLSSNDPIESIPKAKTALIVDDVPSVCRYHETVLRAAGFTCLVAQNGLEAVAILKTTSVDFVMVDLVMPTMGGAELIQRLRANPASARVPVLVVTAETKSDELRKERTETTGPVGYVRKPVKPKALRDEVNRLLR